MIDHEQLFERMTEWGVIEFDAEGDDIRFSPTYQTTYATWQEKLDPMETPVKDVVMQAMLDDGMLTPVVERLLAGTPSVVADYMALRETISISYSLEEIMAMISALKQLRGQDEADLSGF